MGLSSAFGCQERPERLIQMAPLFNRLTELFAQSFGTVLLTHTILILVA
jgi:hypothetical protein